jgi:hypothetical protein
MTQVFRIVVRGVLVVAALAALVGVDAPAAQAQGEKVTICHIPPGNPENAHTITISVNALAPHMELHGDKVGECDGGGGT